MSGAMHEFKKIEVKTVNDFCLLVLEMRRLQNMHKKNKDYNLGRNVEKAEKAVDELLKKRFPKQANNQINLF